MARQTLYEWNGIQKGDAVNVSNERGKFTFLEIVVDTDTNDVLWVSVHGGIKGREKMRAFVPARISSIAKSLRKQNTTNKERSK